jgi:hypothetical protein
MQASSYQFDAGAAAGLVRSLVMSVGSDKQSAGRFQVPGFRFQVSGFQGFRVSSFTGEASIRRPCFLKNI